MLSRSKSSDSNIQEEVPDPELQSSIIKKWSKPFAFYATIFSLAFLNLMASIDSISSSAALPSIVSSLSRSGPTPSTFDVYWTASGYLLAQTVMMPIFGSASEFVGRKICILSATAIFLIGSVLCGVARNIGWLIGARVIQGFGSAGILTMGPTIITDIVSLRERGNYTSLMAFVWAVGTNAGVVIGGVTGQESTWRWIFWINLPVGGICFISLATYMNLQLPSSSLKEKLSRIDYLGILVFTISTTLFLVGITLGGTVKPWSSPATLCPLLIGLVGGAAFVWIESHIAVEPLVPMVMFKRTAAAGYVGVFFHGFTLSPFCYFMPLYFLGVLGDGRLTASLKTLAGVSPASVSAALSGIIVAKRLRFRNQMIFGWIIAVVGLGLMGLMTAHAPAVLVYLPSIIASIGSGILFIAPLFAIQSVQTDDMMGIATSTEVFIRNLSLTMGVAIASVIFQNQFDRQVHLHVLSGQIPTSSVIPGRAAVAAWEIIRFLPESLRNAYHEVYANALRWIWLSLTPVVGMGLVASLFAKNESLDRDLKSKQGFVDIQTRRRDLTVGAVGA